MQDIGEWEALTKSKNAFPAFPHEQARKIRIPAMLLSGGRSVEAFKVLTAELARTLPKTTLIVLPNATHEMWSEFPEECTRKLLPFLETQRVNSTGAARK